MSYFRRLMQSRIFWIALTILGLAGCRPDFEGNPKNNQAPETHLMVDTIQRSGADRFSSQVMLHWWGTDPDGYVKGYYISVNGTDWTFTERQDSLLKFAIPAGNDTFDFKFYVKAADNLGIEDPSPATLGVPVKNSSPTLDFVTPQANPGTTTRFPVRTFPVLKYSLIVNDFDGKEDLSRIELVWNDTQTTPFSIPARVSDLTIVATDPKAINSDCQIYSGNSTTPLPGRMAGMRLDANNVLYARVIDQVGSKSAYKAAPSIFVKRVRSGILLVNGYTSLTAKATAQAYYAGGLKALGKDFDTLQLTEIVNGNYSELSPDNLTQDLVFRLFKHIVWFTDEGNFNLAFAQKTLLGFFNSGGNLFMSCAFNSSFDTTAGYLSITPAQRLVPSAIGQTYRMVSRNQATAYQPGWPALECNASPFLVRPMFRAPDATNVSHDYLYKAKIRITGSVNTDWESNDSTNIAIRRKVAGGKTQFILFSLPLEKMNGLNNSDAVLRKLLIDELGL